MSKPRRNSASNNGKTPPKDIRAWAETASREELFDAFKPLAYKLAHRYADGSEDAISDAMLALWSATATYDPHRGAFSNWASMYIRSGVERGSRKFKEHVTIPLHFRRQMGDIYAAQQQARAKGEDISEWEAAVQAKIPSEEAKMMLTAPIVSAATEGAAELLAVAADSSSEPKPDELINELTEWAGEELPLELLEKIDWWRNHDGSNRGAEALAREVQKFAKKAKRRKR